MVVSIRMYTSFNKILFKLMSNLVSTKVWILGIASVAMFIGIIDQYVWAGVIGGLFGVRELVKPMMVKAQNGRDEEKEIEE